MSCSKSSTCLNRCEGSGSFNAFFVLSGLTQFLIAAEHCSCRDLGLHRIFSIQSRNLESVTNLSAVKPRQFLVHKLALACISLWMHFVWLCLAAKCNGVSSYDVPCVTHIVFAFTSAPYLLKLKVVELLFVTTQLAISTILSVFNQGYPVLTLQRCYENIEKLFQNLLQNWFQDFPFSSQ